MSNVPAKNKTNGKTSKVNVIQRTTTETLRLTDSNCNSKGRTTEMSNQPPRKKPTSSFQVTGVSVISADAGDDSTDDLEESRTDETSISDDTYSKETDEAHLTQNISTIPSSISSVPSAVISSINCSNTSVATASSSDTAEGLNVSSTSSKKFSDRFKVVKVESTVPFYRGRWTCMDYLDHSVHTPKDAYVYCQHQQQYVKASSQLVQTSSVPNTVRQGQSCSLLQQTSSQSIPAQSLQIQQSNEILNVQDGNNQQNLIMQTVQIQNNSDSVAQTPVQNRVQIENIQQPIEAIMLNEEQLPDVSRMQLPPANVIAQNAYQQLNPGNIYSPCPFTPFQSVPTLYNQPCHGILPPMDFHPTSFRYDLPWLIYAGMSSPVGVRYVPPPTQQITQSVPFLPVLPNECTYAHQKPPQACMSQSFVPSFENGQFVSKNIPPKGERRPETTTAAFTMKENLTSVTATLPAYAQSMCQMTQPSYSEKIISKELIDNKDLENPVSTTHGVSNTHLIEVPVPPVTSSVITVSSTSNNDISVSSVQTNNTCVAAKKVNNNTSVAFHQITKSSASSEDTESVSGGSTVAIDNKIAQAMDLVKSHLMYAVREEVEVLKERISELLDRINQLEVENSFLRANASAEVLSALNDRADESQQKEGPNKYSTTNNTHGGLN